MGLLDEYGVDVDEFETITYDQPDDGYYEFEVADVFLREGTENHPDKRWIIFRYIVGDTGKQKDEWFQLPEDASAPTDKERQALGFYRARLISLGFSEESLGSVSREDIIGIAGTFKLETRKGFQNVYNLKVEQQAPAPPPKPAARPAARPGARPARPTPAQEPQETAEDDEPEDAEAEAKPATRPAGRPSAQRSAPPPKAAQAGVRRNPFGK